MIFLHLHLTDRLDIHFAACLDELLPEGSADIIYRVSDASL